MDSPESELDRVLGRMPDATSDEPGADLLADEPLTEQADLDALVADIGGGPKQDDSLTEEPDLDSLIEVSSDAVDEGAPDNTLVDAMNSTTLDDVVELDDSTIDALLRGESEDVKPADPLPEASTEQEPERPPRPVEASEPRDTAQTKVDQAVIDALLNARPMSVEPLAESISESESIEEIPVDQADIDALFAAAAGGGEPKPSSLPAEPDAGASVDQGDINALINAQLSAEPAPPEAIEEIPVDQADIDALFAAAAGGVEPEPEPTLAEAVEEVPVDQADIDALLAPDDRPEASTPDTQVADSSGASESFDQATIDALLAEEHKPRRPEDVPSDWEPLDDSVMQSILAAEADPGGLMKLVDQSAIDALLAEAGYGAAPPADEIGEALDQSAAHALLAEEDVESAHGEAPVSGSIDQDEIDAIMSGEGAAMPVAQSGDESALDQSAIDALLNAAPSGAAPPEEAEDGVGLDQSAIDALLNAPSFSEVQPAETDEIVGLDQSDIDALLSGDSIEVPDMPAAVPSAPPREASPAKGTADEPDAMDAFLADALSPDGADDSLSPDQLDDLLAVVEPPQKPPRDEEDTGNLLSQEDLDSLIAQATVQAREPEPELADIDKHEPVIVEETDVAPEVIEQPAPPPPAKPKKERKLPSVSPETLSHIHQRLPKIAASLAAGLLLAFGSFTYLYTHQVRPASEGAVQELASGGLRQAVSDAERLLDMKAFAEARTRLDQALKEAPASPLRTQAEFLRAKAAHASLLPASKGTELDRALDAINIYLEHSPSDANRPQAMRWKADIYEREDIPHAALDIFREIAALYPSEPAHDTALFDAGRLALTVDRPEDAVGFLTELLQKYPASSVAGKAKLLLGDAFRDAGNADQAHAIYSSISQLSPTASMGAQAQARLAELVLSQGKPDEAILLLESRISAATSIEGNDDVLLTLAKAYRAANRPEDARRTLTDLVDFMPDSNSAPAAYSELTRLYMDMNDRDLALRTARQAAAKFPDHPDVLRNLGELLSTEDDTREAAQLLVAAHEKGAGDADLLIKAARLFRDADAQADAETTYRKVLRDHPRTPQSFEAEIDLCELTYEQGAYQKAIRQLEDLAVATPEGPGRLPVLLALGSMYEELGIYPRVNEIFSEVASLSSEPSVLARTAVSLFEADAWDAGAAAAARVDVSRLADDLAFTFLTTYGQAMLQASPAKAVPLLDKAYREHPGRRTQKDRIRLFDACLLAEDLARARSVLIDLQDEASLNAAEASRFIGAATRLGDYYYDRQDFTTAAAAYEQAAQADNAATRASLWALYARANSLLKLSDFENSLALFDRVAVAAVPFSKDAQIKADYIRLEMRMRGMKPQPPVPAVTG